MSHVSEKREAAEMGARVSRKWARISLSFAMASAAVLVLTAVLGQLLDLGPEGAGWMIGGVLLAGLLMVLAVAALWKLRCPGCGAQTVRPQWGPGRRLHCPLCGAPLVYDDEADGASEDDGTGREERWRSSFRD